VKEGEGHLEEVPKETELNAAEIPHPLGVNAKDAGNSPVPGHKNSKTGASINVTEPPKKSEEPDEAKRRQAPNAKQEKEEIKQKPAETMKKEESKQNSTETKQAEKAEEDPKGSLLQRAKDTVSNAAAYIKGAIFPGDQKSDEPNKE